MVTMRDVARRANVSVSTVSFVVNGTKPVTPATRQRIEQAMADLGFRRNVLARALASDSTRILALVFPAVEHRLGSTALGVVTSAAVSAGQRGYNLVMWPVSNDANQLDDYVAGGLVDGVILMEVQLEDPRVERLKELDVPFVLVGRTEDPTGLSYVDMDFDATVNAAVDHLEDLGHTQIALLIGRLPSDALPGYGPIVRTEAAFRARMERSGRPALVVDAAQNAPAGREAAHALLTKHPETTAIVVMNEDASFGVVNGLRDAGRHAPEDVSVISIVTSSETAGISDPPLTTMVAPSAELGRRSVDALIDLLEQRSQGATQVLEPCVLRPAGSTGPVPDQRRAPAPASS